METRWLVILWIIGFVITQLIVLWLFDQRARRNRLRRVKAGGSTPKLPARGGSVRMRFQAMLTQAAALTAERVSVVKGGQAEASTKLLKAAGIRNRDALLIYAFLKLLLPVSGVTMALIWLAFYSRDGLQPVSAVAIVCGCALLLSHAPEFYLARRRDRRLQKARRTFPDMLELLVIASEAGLGPVPALTRVAREIFPSCPDLAVEIQQLVIELNLLPDRGQAWKNLEERLPLPEISVFANAMSQAGKYGSPFRGALRSLMQDARAARLLRIEEQAGRLPALMTIPMILFIMPALFVVLIGPASLSILDNIMNGGMG